MLDCDPPTSICERTAGDWFIKLMSPLRLEGTTSSVSFVSTVTDPVDCTSTVGDADTVIDSSIAPTFSATSTRAMNPAVRRTFSRRTV